MDKSSCVAMVDYLQLGGRPVGQKVQEIRALSTLSCLKPVNIFQKF